MHVHFIIIPKMQTFCKKWPRFERLYRYIIVLVCYEIVESKTKTCFYLNGCEAGLQNILHVGSMQPARAFSIVENAAKAQPRINNCSSIISSILQRNLYIKIK